MSDSSSQQKANLARIRDNQRRSRARRKEYLQELETKYRTCEAVGVEASAEIQTAARKVLDENKRLRQMLRQVGMSDAEIDGCHYEGSENDESQNFPTASALLDTMLATRKACKPSSAGGCGEGTVCKIEDEAGSRRQSSASTPASQQTLKPAITPRPISSGPSAQQRHPQDQTSVTQHSRQLDQVLPHSLQEPVQLMQQSPPQQPQLPLQYQNHYLPPQQPQPQLQQQHYISPPHPRPLSIPTPQDHTSPTSYTPTYPLYAPQPYAYAASSQLLDWGLSNPTTASPYSTPNNKTVYTSPISAPAHTYPFTPQGYAAPDTSSCFSAADAIRAMNPGAGQEVEAVLGCTDNGNECRVDNATVFEVMDRYSGIQGIDGM